MATTRVTPTIDEDTGHLCPTCSGPMWWKRNRSSQSWFMGCKKWPTCNGTRDAEGNSSVISPQRANRMWAILKAAVLNNEDECLTFTQTQIENAEGYELHLDEIPEEKTYILTVKKK